MRRRSESSMLVVESSKAREMMGPTLDRCVYSSRVRTSQVLPCPDHLVTTSHTVSVSHMSLSLSTLNCILMYRS